METQQHCAELCLDMPEIDTGENITMQGCVEHENVDCCQETPRYSESRHEMKDESVEKCMNTSCNSDFFAKAINCENVNRIDCASNEMETINSALNSEESTSEFNTTTTDINTASTIENCAMDGIDDDSKTSNQTMKQIPKEGAINEQTISRNSIPKSTSITMNVTTPDISSTIQNSTYEEETSNIGDSSSNMTQTKANEAITSAEIKSTTEEVIELSKSNTSHSSSKGISPKREKSNRSNSSRSKKNSRENCGTEDLLYNKSGNSAVYEYRATKDEILAGINLLLEPKLVLKYCAVAEGTRHTSIPVTTCVTTIGRSSENTISLPRDTKMSLHKHAIIEYFSPKSANSSTVEDQGDVLKWGEMQNGQSSFFLTNGSTNMDFATSIRLSGLLKKNWPLLEGSSFSICNTVFRCTRIPPDPSLGTVKEIIPKKNSDSKSNEKTMMVEPKQFEKTLKSEQVPKKNVATINENEEIEGVDSQVQEKLEKIEENPRKTSSDNCSSSKKVKGKLWLLASIGPMKGQILLVGSSGATLGRALDNDTSIEDQELSRHHSRIDYDSKMDEFFLCDVGSLNGTFMQLVGPYAKKYRLGFDTHFMVGCTGYSVNRFDFGQIERTGPRPTMEDKSIITQNLEIPGLSGTHLWPQTFAGVYDGHGGTQASEYLFKNLHTNLGECLQARSEELTRIEKEISDLLLKEEDESVYFGGYFSEMDNLVLESFREAFKLTDHSFIHNSENPQAGSTATTALIMGGRVYIANVGDSRTILSRNGKVFVVSEDHKPERPDEEERIRNSGGYIVHKRVMGNLAVSRAFGDAEFKRLTEDDDTFDSSYTRSICGALVISEPEFIITQLTGQEEFMVLACDGLFDVFTNSEIVKIVMDELRTHGDPQKCCENITLRAIKERHTRDNVSMILLLLKPIPLRKSSNKSEKSSTQMSKG